MHFFSQPQYSAMDCSIHMAELERSKRLYTDVGDDQEGLVLVQARLTSGKASLVPIMYASLKEIRAIYFISICFSPA